MKNEPRPKTKDQRQKIEDHSSLANGLLQTKMKVILAAGGSGGHIFPSVALASELEKIGVKDISFVSSRRRLDKNLLKDTKHACFFLSVNPMPLRFDPIRMMVFLFKLITDVMMSVSVIMRVKPDVVVGFGGYSSGAIVVGAKLLGIPVLIHEQNFEPGRANKILGRIADCIAVSFQDSSEYFPYARKKVFYSGNPLRLDILHNDRLKSAGQLGVSPDKITVLIMGGSQGSSFINKTVSRAAFRIRKEKNNAIQFIHLTGKKDYEWVKRFYEENNISGKVFSFMERIDGAYAVSDLVISRSGAAAVFELAFYSKAMILVPYPSPKSNQRSNAIYFSRVGAAVYKEEKELSEDDLGSEILNLLNDNERRMNMAQAAGRLSVPEAGSRLAEEVVRVGSKNRG